MTYRRIVSAALVPVMFLQFSGCTRSVWVMPEDVGPEESGLKAVVTTESDTVAFDVGRGFARNDTIRGFVDRQPYQVAFDAVRAVRVNRTDELGSAALIFLSLAIVGGVIAISVAMENMTLVGN